MSMGSRRVRSFSSNSEGGGSLSNSHRRSSNGPRNTQLVTKGIQNSDTPQSRMINAPDDFARPAEKIKLTDKPAPSTSVYRLPSRYPDIIPHTKPNGNPLINRNIMLYGGDTMSNSNQDTPAIFTIR